MDLLADWQQKLIQKGCCLAASLRLMLAGWLMHCDWTALIN